MSLAHWNLWIEFITFYNMLIITIQAISFSLENPSL